MAIVKFHCSVLLESFPEIDINESPELVLQKYLKKAQYCRQFTGDILQSTMRSDMVCILVFVFCLFGVLFHYLCARLFYIC